MIRWISKYKIVTILFCSCSFLFTPIYSANSVERSKLELFLDFRREVLDIIESGMEPLNKLYGALNEEEVYNNALSAKQNFIRSSQSLLELKVPIALPDDTKTLIERSKVEIASGLKFLGEGMNYLAQYIASRNPVLYDKYIEKRERGILYVHGGLTTLDSARLQLDASEEPLKIIWEVDEKTFFNQEHPQ